MPTYYLVGAFDRHNYGDILFPAVHREYILNQNPDAKIEYVAITESDMTDCGGFRTLALKDVLGKTLSPEDRIILCGGDILSADWMLMVAHISSRWLMKPARVLRRILGVEMTNQMVRRMMGERNEYPYVVGPEDTQAAIYYTSVGGAGFSKTDNRQLKRVSQLLKGAAAVSVRDTEVEQLLSQEGVTLRCTPDTALIMSDLFTLDMLNKRDWKGTVRTFGDFDFERYYSFQGAKRLIESDIETLANEIETVYQQTGFAPMMVPIGRAPDHEDHIPLEALVSRLRERGVPCAIQDSEHILSIMASLASAETYVGTSLHGAITTYAYGKKPCALMSDDVKKLKDFLNTWLDSEDYRLYPTAAFGSNLTELLKQGGRIGNSQRLDENKAMVNQVIREYL
jgi:hypothetical protein